MSDDETALLTAVHAAPDDDLPRLAYADWLDERGQSDRAEFIRVDCAAARLYGGHADEQAVEERQYELRKDEWRVPIEGWESDYGIQHYGFRRGFPGSASVFSADQFFTVVNATRWPDALDSLNIHGDAWPAEDVRKVFASPALGRIRELSLHSFDASVAEHLFASPAVANLETLSLESMPGPVVAALTAARMPALRRLQLWSINANAWLYEIDECDLALDRLLFLDQLEELTVQKANIGRNTLGRLLQNHTVPRLRSLCLQMVRAVTGEGSRVLAACPWLANVVALHVGNNDLDDDDLTALCRSPHATNLHTLFIRANFISDDGVAELCPVPAPGRPRAAPPPGESLSRKPGGQGVGGVAVGREPPRAEPPIHVVRATPG